MIPASRWRGFLGVATAVALVAGTACIEGHPVNDPAVGILGPVAIGRDPAVISEIVGRVYDQQTGAAIAGARVFVANLETLSAADGNYRLTSIAAQVVVLEATKEGYEARAVQLPLAAGPNTYQIFMRRIAP